MLVVMHEQILFCYDVKMNSSQPHKGIRRRIWREANVRLLPSGIVSIIGATISHDHGKVLSGSFDNRIIAALGLILFII
jgi:hypothetical protein